MTLTASDYDAIFWDRDAIKRRDGLSVCETEFSRRFAEEPTNGAIALNYGICLLEHEKHAEAEHVLGILCTSGDGLIDVPHWLMIACRSHAEAIRRRSDVDAVQAIGERFPLFEMEQRFQLMEFMLTHILTTENFNAVTTLITSTEEIPPFSRRAVRRYSEVANAVNRRDSYRTIFGETQCLETQHELALISLLHDHFPHPETPSPDANEDAVGVKAPFNLGSIRRFIRGPARQSDAPLSSTRDGSWANLFTKAISSDLKIDPFDAYRLSLQLPGRLGAAEAEKHIVRFIRSGEEYYSCSWLLGALLEEKGDVTGALAAYHAGACGELRAQGLKHNGFPITNPSRVKVSAIALSFNDVELVHHYCTMLRPHCDELVVNDGGSTDGTIEAFRKFSAETGFPIHIILDRQANFRERTIFNKDGYRDVGAGGVAGFEADRRRTTTLMVARHPYILIADLDDYFPPYPSMKTIVASSYGIDSFAGARRELVDQENYCDLYVLPRSNMPTLFKRDTMHVFSGISDLDEYLARLDQNLALRASDFMVNCLTRAYHYWHLKWILDARQRDNIERFLGPKYAVQGILHRPNLPEIMKIKAQAVRSRELAAKS